MKKILALVLALCMVFVLCACGAAETAPEATSDGEAAAANSKLVDTETVAVGAVIIARDDVPEDVIYTLVSTIFENKDEISQMHAKGEELDLDVAASITSVPYHPGAAKYFKEKGIDVASVKKDAGEGDVTPLTFGTGGESGTYYAYGGVLAQYVSANTDLSITAITSDASKTNVQEIDAGNDQIAFCQSDVMTYAFEGNADRDFDAPIESFSVVAALYPEQVQIVTTNPNLTSVADLEGKKVSVGASGSGTYFNAMDILGAYGLTEDDIDAKYQSFGDSADSLKDGKIDAAFIVAGAPTTAITDLATSGDVYLISMDEEHIDSLLKGSPFYSANTIKAGTY